jgi:hypothetical protein
VARSKGLIPVQFLRLLCNLKVYSLLLCITSVVSLRDAGSWAGSAGVGGVSEGKGHVPRSLMFIIPAALELTLRCFAPSLGGLDERPWTAESTLLRGLSADMIAC